MEKKLTSHYEPSKTEVLLTLGLGLTILYPYYKHFSKTMALRGNEKVLDFGSGSGACTRFIAAALRDKGEIACVDVSTRWMGVIKMLLGRQDRVSFYCGHLDQLDIPEEYFDLVTMHFVLHDIPEAEQPTILRLLVKKLKIGGELIMREPAEHGLKPEDMQKMGEEAGLTMKRVRTHIVKPVGTVIDMHLQR